MNTVLIMTLSGSVLALLLAGLRYTVLRKMPSTVYYYAWLLVLLRFALPLPGLVPTTGGTAEDKPAATPVVYSEMNDQENTKQVTELKHSNVTKSVPAESKETHIALDAKETQEMTVTEAAPKASLSVDWRSPKLWLSIWATGAVLSLGITVFSYLRFSFGLKRDLMEPDDFTKEVYASIPGRKPALYFSDSARTPMMLGVFTPKIVLPYRKYDEELLLNIVRHELTHYRRFDTVYKWATVAILSAHWFNPLAWFIRRELNRACEMSCDEMLLRSMNRDEKQSYGNSLLLMAASTALPSAVVATSFATEKRNLKERLVQIMSYKKSSTRLIAAVLAVTLLTGCGVAAGPVAAKASEAQSDTSVVETTSETQSEAPKAVGGTVKVKNVDEFLAAIAPNTVIELSEGAFDLSKASDYAKESKSKYYTWNEVYSDNGGSAELIIHDVDGLTIRGAGTNKTVVEAVPRYANVIKFSGCKNLTVTNFTAGHTREPGECTGGVLLMSNCNDITVDTCGLYGCGTFGVRSEHSKKLTVTNSKIYECSYGAVEAYGSEDILICHSEIYGHSTDAVTLFNSDDCSGFTVYNCKIHDNIVGELLCTRYSENVFFLSNEVKDNSFDYGIFYFEQFSATVDGCYFDSNSSASGWYKEGAHIKATDIKGKQLDAAQFKAMKLRDINPETAVPKTPTPAVLKEKEVAPGGEITVKTIDDFLSAIGSDRTVILDGKNFNLSKAKNYGGTGTKFYSWENVGDGPALIIHDVKNLVIKAKNPDPAATTLEALPRYADVLCFRSCENITVSGFTAGHTKEMGECSGGVLEFTTCNTIKVEKMRLFGCGTLGIETMECYGIDVLNTEIYECSYGACDFYMSHEINLKDCNIHDVPSPALRFTDCDRMIWNDQRLSGKDLKYDVKAGGTLETWNDG